MGSGLVAGRGSSDLDAYARTLVSRVLAVLVVAGVAAAPPPPNVAVTRSGGAVQEGGLARDPRAPAHLAIAYWDDRRGTCSLAVSSNAGATWTSRALPALPPGASLCRNAVVAFGPDRTLYVAYEAAGLSGFAQIELARSRNGGASFGAPVLLDPDAAGGGDREPSIVAGKGGRVVVSFQHYDESEQSASVAVVSSSDRGGTFSAPVAASPAGQNAAGSRAALALDRAGRLYVGWVDGSGVDLDAGGGTARVVVASSRDGGRTFGRVRTVAQVPSGCGPNDDCGNRYPAVSLVAPSAGHVVAAWSAGAFPDPARISFARSAGGGQRWTGRKTLAPLPRSADRDQHSPDLAAAPDGRVDLVFLDQARDADTGIVDVEHVHSLDGGNAFSRPAYLDRTAVATQRGDVSVSASVASSNASAAVAWSVGDVVFAARADSAAPKPPVVRGSLVVREGRAAVYRLSATDAFTPTAALRFLCGVDAAPLRPCAARLSLRLPPGPHVLRVRAVDAAGNRSAVTRLVVRSVALRAR
jgi:hypothetical protein